MKTSEKVAFYQSTNIFDACYNILDIVVKWPGSTHDSRILMESCLTQLFKQMPLLLTIHVIHRNLLICFWPKHFCFGGVHLILLINTFLYPISFHRLCHGLVGNFFIFTLCIAKPKLLLNAIGHRQIKITFAVGHGR